MQLPLWTLFAVASVVRAIPTGLEARAKSAATSAVSSDTVNSVLLRPAFHARASYCSANSVLTLACGSSCDVIKDMKVLIAGGDDGEIPGFYVASDPTLQAIVVAHQGTDPTKLLSIANDAEIKHVTMNPQLFPTAADGVEVHDGFHKTQGRTAQQILGTVQSALKDTGFTKVLTTGHSLGGAIALLDATMFRMQLPSSIKVQSVTFGMPRVGNQQFADMVDSILPGFTRVTNQNDIVPIVPPRALDYEQVSGEVHIAAVDDSTGAANIVSCPGQENDNCSQGNSLLRVSISDHLGPYFNGISFGGKACPL
ncbi:alpha/beta-hydrolase [Cristinia sonorae]|uniref:Alpha/beta-hydrolase n=1 Tax=Cristinia sonorae TaxID=1940300 RepID=A0A8K0XMB1_9AGAR|nr:alpha/beta-hydrolase [Cristinia sonorae]